MNSLIAYRPFVAHPRPVLLRDAIGQATPPPDAPVLTTGSSALDTAARVASVLGAAGGAYHGYLRHHGSVGWAVVWGLLGGMAPIITIPVAIAQGFGKPGR